MKTEHFKVPGSLWIERQIRREGPSPVFIAWKPGTSQSFFDRKALLRFAAWPKSTPTGTALREWLDSFDGKDQKPDEAQHQEAIKQTGFGPEAHLDPSDPNYQTRTVI